MPKSLFSLKSSLPLYRPASGLWRRFSGDSGEMPVLLLNRGRFFPIIRPLLCAGYTGNGLIFLKCVLQPPAFIADAREIVNRLHYKKAEKITQSIIYATALEKPVPSPADGPIPGVRRMLESV